MNSPTQKRRVARNVLVTLATQLISWGLTFAVTLYLPRYVGDTGLGDLAVADSFVAIFGVFVPLGTSTVLIREIARDHDRTGEMLSTALLLRLPIGLLMGLLAFAAAFLLHCSPLIRLLVLVAAGGMVIAALNDALIAALQGQENMTRQSAAVLVEKFLASGLTIYLVIARAPLWVLAGVALFTGIVSLTINFSAFRRLLPTLRWPTASAIRALVVAGLPFMGWAVFRTLYSRTDPVILKVVADAATVGWYAAAARLVGTSLFLPAAITTALLPALSRLHREGTDGFQPLARRMLGLVMLCGIPVSLVLMLVPDRIITMLHYPAGFANSIPVLRVGGLSALLYYAAMALGTAVVASDGENKMMRVSIFATIGSIPACFAGAWLTGHFYGNGAIGAMGSDALLEMYLICCYLRMVPERTFIGENLVFLGRCAAAALPMTVFLALTSQSRMGLWVIAPCALIYAVMCLLLRCVSAQDLTMARQIFAKRA
ncbi:MAG: flippase [Janthinobacterium lividum]